MHRFEDSMSSCRRLLLAAATLYLLTLCQAGPLGPLPNVTSSDLGLKEGGCAVGDVVYGVGEAVPGAAACEQCACGAGGRVQCQRPQCEPRPGCKALHRPDHCCPTYQCECEQEGRVYGNGEKLVDPEDPCRVCYCQGGEVVCRRIACFLRDDCTPRLVPGRCCPEYDNCPLRGVTTVPAATPSVSTIDQMVSSAVPTLPKETVKQEITIKEITPVSEIPVISDVKVKEILPSPALDVSEYSSSKSPLIVREATTESASILDPTTKTPFIIKVQPLASTAATEVSSTLEADQKSSEASIETRVPSDLTPSKISLSTQDSINSDIYSSVSSNAATAGTPPAGPAAVVPVAVTSKPAVIEEEDPALFDHNPAFPPLPDDLSVLGNHEEELTNEQVAEADHAHDTAPPHATTSSTPLTTVISSTHSITQTVGTEDGNSAPGSRVTTDNLSSTSSPATTETTTTKVKYSPMLNLRSAIPTEILNVPSYVQEEITGELDDVTESVTTARDVMQSGAAIDNFEGRETTTDRKVTQPTTALYDITTSNIVTDDTVAASSTRDIPEKIEQITHKKPVLVAVSTTESITENTTPKILTETTTTTTVKPITTKVYVTTPRTVETTTAAEPTTIAAARQDYTADITSTSGDSKSNIATEITAQTEFSSIPIETSDQNPQENAEVFEKQKNYPSTTIAWPEEQTATTNVPSIQTEIITVSRVVPSSTNNVVGQSYENVETTEFLLTSFGSSESATDAVELIKISAEPDKRAAIIDTKQRKKTNVLSDLIDLVGDVASIGDRSESTAARARPAPSPTAISGISDSEELIPVNAGYKSKNNNWNVNSITEVPVKSKNPSSPSAASKQKVVEIEDEEGDSLTDVPPPNDKMEPTTRRPVIDNVSDDQRPGNDTDKKDIEIITKSYVPTINRRPTKVVMKKSNDKPVAGEDVEEEPITTTTVEGGVTAAEGGSNEKGETGTTAATSRADARTPATERRTQPPAADTTTAVH